MTHPVPYGLQWFPGYTNADIDRIKAAGAQWIRIQADMSVVFPTSGSFTGDTPDWTNGAALAACTYAKSVGLKVCGGPIYCPAWLTSNGDTVACPPSDYDQYATMCARMYRDMWTVVDAFEIRSEPNIIQFWYDPTNMTNTYPLLLRKCVIAMRTQAAGMSGKTWATPTILSAAPASSGSGSQHWTDRWDRGTNPSWSDPRNISMPTFLDRLFDATNGIVAGTTVNTPYVSGYGVHTYMWGSAGPLNDYFEAPLKHCFVATGTVGGVPVGSSPFAFWDDIIAAREGYTPATPPVGHKKFWATENGWPATTGLYETFGTETDVAGYAATEFTFWELFGNRGAGPMFWFHLRDTTGAGDEIVHYSGLLRGDNSAKPVRATFKAHADAYAPNSTPSGVRGWDATGVTWDDPRYTWDGGLIGSGPAPAAPTVPKIRLELGIHPRPDSGPYLVMDDPSRTLDSTWVLAPEFAYYDISGYASDVQLDQGRNEPTGRTVPGTLSATLNNETRRFDPRNTTGPYYPYLNTPRPSLRLWVDDVLWITTAVDELAQDYYDVRRARSSISGRDGLASLANAKIEWQAKSQSTVNRVNRILDHAGYDGPRQIEAGAFTMGAGPVSNMALDELGLVAEAEDTLLACGADGTLSLFARSRLLGPSVFKFADDGTGSADYKTVRYASGKKLFANQITVTRRAADQDDHPRPQSFANEFSVNDYGRITKTISDCPVDSDGAALLVAVVVGNRYTNPLDRIASITLNLADFAQSTRRAFGLLTPGVVVDVVHHPTGGGVITQQSLIVGRSLNVTGGEAVSAEVTWYVKPRDGGT